MRTKLLTLAAAVAGLALGAGVGVAAAQDGGNDARPSVTTAAAELDSMDQLHAVMRDQLPAELTAQCDEMHAAMPDDMRSMDPQRDGLDDARRHAPGHVRPARRAPPVTEVE